MLALALVWLGAAAASAQVFPAGPILAAADLRDGLSLDGVWTYSIDPYRDGVAGFHGEAAGRGHRRWDDLDVRAARGADPLALFEYDMDTAPGATLPSSWLTHAPAMRHYQGLVWYQRRFDAAPQAGMRYFVRFGAANYAAEAWLNGQRLGRHDGGFTPFAFEVTGLLREGGNRLVVGVDSTHTESTVPPPVTDWIFLPSIVTHELLYPSQRQVSDAPIGSMMAVFRICGSGSLAMCKAASASTFTRTSLYL